MNRMIKYSIFSIALITFLACATIKKNGTANIISSNPLTINQGENRIEIKNRDTIISLNREAFTLEFECPKYDRENKLFFSTRIASTIDKEEYDKVKSGPLAKDHPFFGFATGKSGGGDKEYETMYIDNNGHHYIFYSAEDHKRATLVEELNDKNVRLKWTINSFTINGVTTPIDSTNLNQFYMMYYQDLNLNDTIDSGELTKVQMKIK
ncbi:MAG: hypothetical protein MK066_13150 [Crocinitomicaceae bacterium]|nr:hypothetical protein [Crocinitomicaceae bacterium]